MIRYLINMLVDRLTQGIAELERGGVAQANEAVQVLLDAKRKLN